MCCYPRPFSGSPFPGGYTTRAILLARHTMNRPRTSPPPPRALLLACPHPAPLWCTLCVSAFTVFTSTIQHLSTRFSCSPSPSLSFQSPASLFSTSSLSLTLNKKSLLIARNLWDSAPHRLASSSFFLFIFTLIFVRFSRTPAFIPLSPSFAFFSWNKLRVSASAPITVLSSQIIYIYVCIVVACRCWFDSKAEILFSLSSSVLVDSSIPLCRF